MKASPAYVREWTKRKAALAGGVPPGLSVISLEALESVVQCEAAKDAGWKVGNMHGWAIVRAGLARELCGASIQAIGDLTKRSRSSASRLAKLQRKLIVTDDLYGSRASRIAVSALGVWRAGGR